MSRFDAQTARCEVFTFKEGLLSPVAHDLRLEVTRFTVDTDEAAGTVEATFDPRSLRVACAIVAGHDAPATLSTSDRRSIEERIVDDVLVVKRYPEIRFRSRSATRDGDGWRVEGTLALHGHERPVNVRARRDGGKLVAEVALQQPDFGIKPFSALLGTLRVRPEVKVRLTLPALAGA